MNAGTMIQLALMLINGVLKAAKIQGAPDLVNALENAVTEILKVQGTGVTKSQLDGLRLPAQW